jgi:hypothetical protein
MFLTRQEASFPVEGSDLGVKISSPLGVFHISEDVGQK